MNALVVYCHPVEGSFCSAMRDAAISGLRAAGHSVDVIDLAELTTQGPQTSINEILNYVAPSFTSQTQTVSDGTDHIDPASLRGLGPDQVLVLVNGKRRHNTSLLNLHSFVTYPQKASLFKPI